MKSSTVLTFSVGLLVLAAILAIRNHEGSSAGSTGTDSSHRLPSITGREITPVPEDRESTILRCKANDEVLVDHLTVTVSGFVESPGQVAVDASSTLSSAIHDAGGLTQYGEPREVRLIRGKHSHQYDLTKGDAAKIPLQARDTIQIPMKLEFYGH